MRLPRSLAFSFAAIALIGVAVPLTPGWCTDPATADAISEEDRLGARSDRHSRAFDKAISALVAGDAATFRAMLSSTTVLQETRGPGALDAVIQNAFIPFFADFAALTDEISTAPTYDVGGNAGIAIARSFKTKAGETKPFVIYLITEKDDRVVVGNLLINTTKEVLQRSKQGSTQAASKHPAAAK